MPPLPPSFGSQQYWDERFTKNPNPFDWLEAPTVLDSFLRSALDGTKDTNPEILHIGCGTSLLSYHLRNHVEDPESIHNLDYSEVAIQLGKKREVGFLNPTKSNASLKDDGKETESTPRELTSDIHPGTKFMRWSAVNLLSLSSVVATCKPCTYSVIVDKSTSDSIACSDDVYVPLPYPISTGLEGNLSSDLPRAEPIYPLHILAIHLALLAKPNALWISLSYSEDRYPFLHLLETESPGPVTLLESTPVPSTEGEDEFDKTAELLDIPKEVLEDGLPDPGKLWTLQMKYEIEAPPENLPGQNTTGVVHRPKLPHWVYVLRRTDVKVFVRKS